MKQFSNTELRIFDESAFAYKVYEKNVSISLNDSELTLHRQSKLIKKIPLHKNTRLIRLSSKNVQLVDVKEDCPSYLVVFSNRDDASDFESLFASKFQSSSTNGQISKFDERTDSWSAVQYFQFYSYLSQQQNMMQDYVRTSTYQRAILENSAVDFRGKVVLDVGAGSGILSFFAIQAGAAKVYAVEASNMAVHCNTLVMNNNLAGRLIVVPGKIEDITLDEQVDCIISEPMGYMLYNERMLETYVHARKFLKPELRQPLPLSEPEDEEEAGVANGDSRSSKMDAEDGFAAASGDNGSSSSSNVSRHPNKALPNPGIMFPSVANLYAVPFSDEALFLEQIGKANFWYQQAFHGMDLSSLRAAALSEYFNQPIVDTFDIGQCPALPQVHKVDFRTVDQTSLETIDIPLRFQISTCSTIHGLAFWFDVGFLGSQRDVWLSTSPVEPLTHWYQVRCLLNTPLFVQEGQQLDGFVSMRANSRQSYDVEIELTIPGTQTKITNKLDLKNPYFRYNGYPPTPPPGSHQKPPTETYYTNMCLQQLQQHQQTPAHLPVGMPAVLNQPIVTALTGDAAALLGQGQQNHQTGESNHFGVH